MNNELSGPADEVAQRLLSALLVREVDGRRMVARIVETEAYNQTDAASHSYRGRTPRTEVMFGPAGFLYVYFTYGMHYCMNVVCGPDGFGEAVLIRAVEPVEGEEYMSLNRGGRTGVEVGNGPAKACQAFGVDRTLNGHDLREPPLQLVLQPPLAPDRIVQATRIGITRAVDEPWRFYVRGNPYVSRPRPV
ncbi:MAG TPA: DNA-3-methyladenine glycosylase [Candidatus Saccharimonadales bacterium]